MLPFFLPYAHRGSPQANDKTGVVQRVQDTPLNSTSMMGKKLNNRRREYTRTDRQASSDPRDFGDALCRLSFWFLSGGMV